MLRGERAILAGRARDALGRGATRDAWAQECAEMCRNAPGKKNRGKMAPEQQRQEENGDAAASPHTYRKDRQRDFARVRKIFRFSAIALR
jgi:hypothetical protein